MIYADYDYYITHGGTILDKETADKALCKASETIDILTYNRIYVAGFTNLTEYQQGIIQNVCCKLADFQTENADIIESPLNGYSINGVSVQLSNNSNITNVGGVVIPSALFAMLRTTGLTWGAIV